MTKIIIVNLPQVICNNLIGEEHSHYHRMATGIILMILGVGFSKAFFFIDSGVVHFISDGLGYFIHGVGGIPFIDYMAEKARKRREKVPLLPIEEE